MALRFMNKNSVFGKDFYLNVLLEYMSKKKLIVKNSSEKKILSRFSSLKNKEDIIKNIKIPIQTI